MKRDPQAKKEGEGRLEELRKMSWKSFDELAGKKGAWRETVQESEKVLEPVLKRNKEWRERSKRSMVNFG